MAEGGDDGIDALIALEIGEVGGGCAIAIIVEDGDAARTSNHSGTAAATHSAGAVATA